MARVQYPALETLDTLPVRKLGCGQAARGHDQVTSGDALAVVQRHLPLTGGLIPMRGRHARVEADVAVQVEALGDVFQIAQDFRLCGIAFGPDPVRFQFAGERIAVFHTRDVAACARVAVPVPSAADAARRFDDFRVEAERAQFVQQIQPAEAGTDNDNVTSSGVCGHLSFPSARYAENRRRQQWLGGLRPA